MRLGLLTWLPDQSPLKPPAGCANRQWCVLLEKQASVTFKGSLGFQAGTRGGR